MRWQKYLCLSGREIANGNRTRAYMKELGGASFNVATGCHCDALDQTDDYDVVLEYTNPADDDAPWYDSNRPESEEFLGLFPGYISLGSPFDREMTARSDVGGWLSPLELHQRIISVNGQLISTSERGMDYGESWLYEVLRGCCSACVNDELTMLKSCPDTAAGSDSEPYFRHMVGVGLVDYIPPSQIREGLNEHRIQQVSFQLGAQMPFLYAPAETVIEEVAEPTDQVCGITTTNKWPGDATLRITVEATGGDATDIDITARPTFDDNCPPGHEGSPCWSYRVTEIEQDAKLVIDGRTRKVQYWDPSLKDYRSGFAILDPYVSNRVEGDLFAPPDMAACTSLCVCVENNGDEDVLVTVERFDRSL
jgi:hypothetical protein